MESEGFFWFPFCTGEDVQYHPHEKITYIKSQIATDQGWKCLLLDICLSVISNVGARCQDKKPEGGYFEMAVEKILHNWSEKFPDHHCFIPMILREEK